MTAMASWPMRAAAKPQPLGHSLDGLAAGADRAGVLDPEPPHVLRRRGLERPAQRDHLTTTTLVPSPGFGRQLELVDQPPGAAQAEAEAVAGGPAVGQGQVDVGDARALVGEADPEAAPAGAFVTTSTRARPPPP